MGYNMEHSVILECDREKALLAIEWCKENIDFFNYDVRMDRHNYNEPVVFFFKHDEDATMFKLMWL